MPRRAEHNTIERRKTARQKSFLRGLIHFNNRRSVLDCLVRDISPYGARLIFSDSVTTPDVVDLYIPQKEQTLRTYIVWRNGHEVGVAFAQVAHMEHSAGGRDLAGRVGQLEAEITALKRALKKLKSNTGPEPDAA